MGIGSKILEEAMEKKCSRRLLGMSYRDCVANEEAERSIKQTIRAFEELLSIIKRHKLRWFGHIPCSSRSAKTVLRGSVKDGRHSDR